MTIDKTINNLTSSHFNLSKYIYLFDLILVSFYLFVLEGTDAVSRRTAGSLILDNRQGRIYSVFRGGGPH